MIKRIDHRDVDVLADAGFLTIVEGVTDGGKGMDATALIANAHTDEDGGAIGMPGHGNHARESLRDEIVTDLVGEAAGAAEGGNRSHDQTRIDGAERRIVELLAFEDAGSVVLDDDINFRGERVEKIDARGLGEIETEAFLAAILLNEIGTAAVLDKRQHP